MKRLLIAAPLTLLMLFSLTACLGDDSNSAPSADSDSQQSYKGDAKIPVDDAVYEITGTVTADVDSLTRQTSPARGSLIGVNGYTSGSYFGPVESGKGYVRLKVRSSQPATDSAPEGSIVILKVTDTKGTALLPDDLVTFRCRRQYEAIAAVRDNETFDKNRLGTWEIDYCRLKSPVITIDKAAAASTGPGTP